MKAIDIERLNDMIQNLQDLRDLDRMDLTKEEIEGYLEFFASNIVKPFTTVFEDTKT